MGVAIQRHGKPLFLLDLNNPVIILSPDGDGMEPKPLLHQAPLQRGYLLSHCFF
jgi:hypothetical protein